MLKINQATRLVRESVTRDRRTWFTRLSHRNKQYICDVIKAMKECPEATPNSVAVALIKELKLKNNRRTIANTLEELLNEKS